MATTNEAPARHVHLPMDRLTIAAAIGNGPAPVSESQHEGVLERRLVMEIAIKSSQGRLSLPEPAHSYVPSRRAVYQIDSLPIDEESALQIEKLPRIHGDPFDRILICQSIVHGMTILTPDQLISQYPARVVW